MARHVRANELAFSPSAEARLRVGASKSVGILPAYNLHTKASLALYVLPLHINTVHHTIE